MSAKASIFPVVVVSSLLHAPLARLVSVSCPPLSGPELYNLLLIITLSLQPARVTLGLSSVNQDQCDY